MSYNVPSDTFDSAVEPEGDALGSSLQHSGQSDDAYSLDASDPGPSYVYYDADGCRIDQCQVLAAIGAVAMAVTGISMGRRVTELSVESHPPAAFLTDCWLHSPSNAPAQRVFDALLTGLEELYKVIPRMARERFLGPAAQATATNNAGARKRRPKPGMARAPFTWEPLNKDVHTLLDTLWPAILAVLPHLLRRKTLAWPDLCRILPAEAWPRLWADHATYRHNLSAILRQSKRDVALRRALFSSKTTRHNRSRR